MKKTLFICIMNLCFSAVLLAEGIDIAGVTHFTDTIDHYSAGPGVVYTKTHIPGLAQTIYTLTIDLHNEYNGIETFLGKDMVEGTEQITSACERYSSPGREAIAGINADFFNVSANNEYPLGAPRGGSVQQGIIQKEPTAGWWWAFAFLSEDKVPGVDYLEFNGEVRRADGAKHTFQRVNIPYGSSDLTMYNRYAGPVTRLYENNAGYDAEYERTEVYIELLNGQTWGINRTLNCRVKSKVTNRGGAPIAYDDVILSGIRGAKAFLDSLQVGDEIEVDLRMYNQASEALEVHNLVGGNGVLMVDGELTVRNTADSYNASTYPRTAIGHSADGRWLYLLVADGKGSGGSPGLSTTSVCYILKHMGASHAIGLDGGGSSEMIVNHEVASLPSDGYERQVGNGWMVMATTPVDSTISQITAYKPRVTLPRYGMMTPSFLGYNQYGLLLEKQLEDVVLTCDETVGQVLDDGRFMALDGGVLTATYGEVTTEIQVLPAGDVPLALRLDSVLVDDRKGYPIEINAVVGTTSVPVPADVLTWTIDDPTICSIEEGKLLGLQNGKTFVIGQLGSFCDTLGVQVQLPETSYHIWSDFKSDSIQWKLTKSSAFKDMTFNVSDDMEFAILDFTYKSTRGPFFKLESVLPLYGLPDSVQLCFNAGGAKFSKVIMGLRSNATERPRAFQYDNVLSGGDVVLSIPSVALAPDSLYDFAIFPLWLEYITFNFSTDMVKGQKYSITMQSLRLYYDGIDITYLPSLTLNSLCVYPNPTADNEICVSNYAEDVEYIQLFDIQGRLVGNVRAASGQTHVDVSTLSVGTYFVRVGSETVKLVKR